MEWILRTRSFSRWMRKALLNDDALRAAVGEMKRGLVDADLGGGVCKKRVALPGKGKRGGARTVIATNRGDRWIFIFGFEKNEKDNITSAELIFLQHIAKDLLACSDAVLKKAVAGGELQEVRHEQNH